MARSAISWATSPPSSAATTKPTGTTRGAAQFNHRAGAKFFTANTDLAWGKMLAERDAPGDRERARHLVTAAHTAAVAHGYAGIERAAAEALEHLHRN